MSFTESNEQSLDTATVLRTIAADMAEDAKALDGQPFTGRVIAEYVGSQGAAIAAIAAILADALAAPCAHCGETSAFPGGAR